MSGDNIDKTFTNSTAKSGGEQGSAKHGPKLYAGIAALVLVVVAAVVVAPKLSHEAPVSAAAPTTVVTVAQPLQRDLHASYVIGSNSLIPFHLLGSGLSRSQAGLSSFAHTHTLSGIT